MSSNIQKSDKLHLNILQVKRIIKEMGKYFELDHNKNKAQIFKNLKHLTTETLKGKWITLNVSIGEKESKITDQSSHLKNQKKNNETQVSRRIENKDQKLI